MKSSSIGTHRFLRQEPAVYPFAWQNNTILLLHPVAHEATLSIGFSRQEYWSGLPLPLPGHLPDPGIKPVFLESPALQLDSLPLAPPEKPKHSINMWLNIVKYSIF